MMIARPSHFRAQMAQDDLGAVSSPVQGCNRPVATRCNAFLAILEGR